MRKIISTGIRIALLPAFSAIFAMNTQAQDSDISFAYFEDCLPVRELRCGLWINARGDIALKERCLKPVSSFPPPSRQDSTEQAAELLETEVDDCYIVHTYNLQDSLNNADNDYLSALGNVVDTATFQILASQYCKDRNNIYIIQAMACGGIMFAVPYDKKFRVSEKDPSYALSSENCYHAGFLIKDADPNTFEIIPVEGYPISRDKNNFYWGWTKMSDNDVSGMERELRVELFTQKDLKRYADSLPHIKTIPYIGNCNDPVFWNIVGRGKPMIPLLIDKLTDTRTLKEVYVPLFGGEYTVADAALTVINEIIAGIPVLELAGIEFSADCGYCSYWYFVRESRKNRKRLQKAIARWYDANKDNLVWEESMGALTGDCFGTPVGGHYRIKSE